MEEKNLKTGEQKRNVSARNLHFVSAASINQEQNCTSGSMEMLKCMDRQIFVVSNSA
jgi:hypothetical protein